MAPRKEAEINRLLQFAYQNHSMGRLPDAEKAFRQALVLNPDHVAALQGLSLTLFQTGRGQEAVAPLERLVKADRRNPDSHYNYALALKAANRLDDAADHYAKAIKLRPAFPEALYDLGNVFMAQDKFAQAAEQYKSAIAINPRYAEAYTNLGNALMSQGRPDDALAQWQQALAVNPNYPVALMNIANVHLRRGKVDEAIAQYRKVLSLAPNAIDAHYNLGNALRELGAMAEAISHYDQALRLNPNFAEAHFARCMAQVPIIHRSEAEISERRAAYGQSLRTLSDQVQRMPSAGGLAEGIGSNQPFFLAYQGLNDRDLQTLYGGIICRIMADRFPQAAMPHPPGPNEKVKVGIVSGYFRQHTVWRILLQGWLTQLDRDRFEIYGYHTGDMADGITQSAASVCDRFVKGPLSLQRWRQAILKDAPHVLLYMDIGMDKMAAQLGAQRLAPVQCLAMGHPVTTGMPTMDFFLTSDLMEPADAEAHYSEKLVRLPNISMHYEPLEKPSISMTRADLGLRPDSIAFWSGQSLYKYLPQYDEVFPRIAKEAGDCQFVFIEYPRSRYVTDLFRERLECAFAAHGLKASDHIVVLPRLSQEQFVAAVEPCDIVLDSIGWSGCNSTMEALTYGPPIVTMAGPLMRSRHTAALLTMMGVTETVTETVDDYVAATVRLANDPSWRAAVKNRIAENKHRVYRDRSCITALEDFLDRAGRGSAH